MNNLSLNHEIHNFMKMKENEMPELKPQNIDKMIKDLSIEGRNHAVY